MIRVRVRGVVRVRVCVQVQRGGCGGGGGCRGGEGRGMAGDTWSTDLYISAVAVRVCAGWA